MKKILLSVIMLTLGAFIAALAIDAFLIPNKIIDGGIVGISIMGQTLTKIPVGLFTLVLNLPFIILAYKKFGIYFVLATFYSVSVMSAALFFIHFKPFTEDAILASIFGGVILGVGVGLVLRNNGSLDGTEIVSILLAKKTGFSVGEIIMFQNIFIFLAAGFLYSPNNAMYSILTYFIAYRAIEVVLVGINESKSVFIITDHCEEIGKKIIEKMDTSVTYIEAVGGYSGAQKNIIYCVTSRLEIVKLKDIVRGVDETAFIAVENVHEVEGTRMKKKKGIV